MALSSKWSSFFRPKYLDVSQRDEGEKLTSTISVDDDVSSCSTDTLLDSAARKVKQDGSAQKPFILSYAISMTMFMCGLLMFVIGLRQQRALVKDCWNQHAVYSPAIRHIDLAYHKTRFVGTLDAPSIYRGAPNEELDANWNRITELRPARVSADDLTKSGLSTDVARMAPEYGGDYIVSLEFAHQLHCLNFLRKSIWFNHDYYSNRSVEFFDKPETTRVHLEHCTEMLRQNLMCSADVGIISNRWVKDYPRPYPDFNTVHMCRNFDSILHWAEAGQIAREDGPYDITPQPGDKIWPSPP
ncbi:hypothetical protein MMC25_004078 [Agyrium rufum]|nr:hypothetical protein [Agyrium rufum]